MGTHLTERRDLLKKMAAGGAIVAMAPMVTSTTALADSGTAKCRLTPTSPGTVTVTTTGLYPNFGVAISFTPPPGGSCPCSTSSPTFEYTYDVRVRNRDNTLPRNQRNLESATIRRGWGGPIGGGNTGFSNPTGNQVRFYRLRFGWKAECPGLGTTPAVTCRYVDYRDTNLDGVNDVGAINISPGAIPSGVLAGLQINQSTQPGGVAACAVS